MTRRTQGMLSLIFGSFSLALFVASVLWHFAYEAERDPSRVARYAGLSLTIMHIVTLSIAFLAFHYWLRGTLRKGPGIGFMLLLIVVAWSWLIIPGAASTFVRFRDFSLP